MEDPHTGARFRVIECTPDSVTYRRVRASVRTSTVATAALQEILGEVLDRAYGGGWESFEVAVDPRFWLDHGTFADESLRRSRGGTSSGTGCTTEWRGRLRRALAATRLANQARMSEPAARRTPLVDRGPQRLGWHMSPRTNRRLSPNASLSLPIRTWSSEEREAMHVYRTGSPPTWCRRGSCPCAMRGDPPFDLAWWDGPDLHVAEVKSTTVMNEEHQLRRARAVAPLPARVVSR